MGKQSRLANKYHTCTCPTNEVSFRWNTTRIVDADFEERIEPDGRFLWVVSACGSCGENILHGTTFTDYRTTGKQLVVEALEKAKRWILGNCKHLKLDVDEQAKAIRFEKTLTRIWDRYLKVAKSNVCAGCGTDLTQEGAVIRTYLVKGRYDKKGYFDNTGSLNSTDDPDICTVCGDPVLSVRYPEFAKVAAR